MRLVATLVVIFLAFILALEFRFGSIQIPSDYVLPLLTALLLSALVLPGTGVFRKELRGDLFRRSRRILAGWALVLMLMIVVAAALKVSAVYSRIWFGYWAVLGSVCLLLLQMVEITLFKWLRQRGWKQNHLLLIGGQASLESVQGHLKEQGVASEYSMRDAMVIEGEVEEETLNRISSAIHDHPHDQIWITLDFDQAAALHDILNHLQDISVNIRVIPDLFQFRLLNQKMVEHSGISMIDLCAAPLSGGDALIKAIMDRGLALILLLLLSPLLLLVALLVKVSSPGPVLFKQVRHGISGEEMTVWKFRSMVVDAEQQGFKQASRGDARITPLGRILRRTSIDELPQLLNVLIGNMSLVGPRPHVVSQNQFFKEKIPRYMLRHKVKPGMTGWAQIHGFRGETETEEKMARRVEYDLWYIQNWTLCLDLKILLMTPLALFGKNAH